MFLVSYVTARVLKVFGLFPPVIRVFREMVSRVRACVCALGWSGVEILVWTGDQIMPVFFRSRLAQRPNEASKAGGRSAFAAAVPQAAENVLQNLLLSRNLYCCVPVCGPTKPTRSGGGGGVTARVSELGRM